MSKQELQQEALSKAVNGQSAMNYKAIHDGFTAKGIDAADIEPRVNIFTFNAWKALGRSVKKGEHGVRVCTYVSGTVAEAQPDGTEKERSFRAPRTTTVFHISQTEVK